MSTTWTYASTDLVTGRVIADTIPLAVQSFSQQINGGGSLTASLALESDAALNAPYLAALEPRRSVLWVMADSYPVWCGVVWDWPDMSRADGTLQISAQTIDSLFDHRVISAQLEYPAVDLFGVFTDLVQYGTSKSSPYISSLSPFTGPASPLVAAAARVAYLVMPQGAAAVSGVPWTASYAYSDLGQISSAFSDLVSVGLEFAFVPGLDASGGLQISLSLGYDSGLGRPAAEAGYVVTYPQAASDYGYQRTGSQSSNYLWATAPPNGSAAAWESQYPHGVDLGDLRAGYPLMESSASWQGSTVTGQSQVDAFADGEAGLVTQAITIPVLTVPEAPGVRPRLRDLVLGDVFPVAAISPLHPPGTGGQPGLQQLVRLTGWTMYPPGDQQAPYMQLTTSPILQAPAG